jgi:hypothetical protein
VKNNFIVSPQTRVESQFGISFRDGLPGRSSGLLRGGLYECFPLYEEIITGGH